MNLCQCTSSLVCPDSAQCVLCGREARPEPGQEQTVRIPVSEYDALLQYRRRVGYVAERQ